jgi:hypothetical protein
MFLLLMLTGCLVNTDLYERRKEALTDHDGDGFVQEDDCDDTDADVFPGAPELCDGVLQDCDGAVDVGAGDAPAWYPDLDADSFGDAEAAEVRACDAPDGHVANALDCDDGATRVNPGAEEVPYDGVDDDCSGADLEDVDADGYVSDRVGGTDCDDGDPEISPGALDTPYDGVDQDCRDGDADDLDGDGQAAVEAGGGDCDDTASAVRVGAEETWADGFTDNDCDGALEPATLTYGDGAWTGPRPNGRLGGKLAALGDVTADARADYLAAAFYDDGAYSSGGAVYLVSGTTGGPLVGVPQLAAGGPAWFLGAALDGGPDVDGDSVPDLLVSATGYASGSGATWLVSGATFAATASPLSPEDVSLASIVGDDPSIYSGSSVRFLDDLMGDGAPWFGVSAPLTDARGFARSGSVAIFDGALRGDASFGDGDVRVDGYFDEANLGGNLTSAGDVDGDGLDDFMVTFASGDIAVIVPGGMASPSLPGDALFRLTGTGAGETAGSVMLGDVDGDGVRDLGCVEGASTLRVFTLLGAAPLRTFDEASATVSFGDGAFGGALLDLGDLDGDGRDETFIPLSWSPEADAAVAVVQTGASLAPGATLDLLDAPLQAISARDGGYGATVALVGDVDGDGFTEIALGGYTDSYTGTNAGGVLTVPVPR